MYPITCQSYSVVGLLRTRKSTWTGCAISTSKVGPIFFDIIDFHQVKKFSNLLDGIWCM